MRFIPKVCINVGVICGKEAVEGIHITHSVLYIGTHYKKLTERVYSVISVITIKGR